MCDKDFDLSFVIDGSGSIRQAGEGNFDRMKTFIKRVIDGFRIGYDNTHVGAVIYSSSIYVKKVFGFGAYYDKEGIFKAIDNIQYPYGGTYTGKALDLARTDLYTSSQDRDDKPNVCIVITDGKADDSVAVPAETLRLTRDAVIFAIGVGKNYDKNELEKMAGNPRNVYTADFNDLENVIERIKLSACQGWFQLFTMVNIS